MVEVSNRVTAGDATPGSSPWRARIGKHTDDPSPAVTAGCFSHDIHRMRHWHALTHEQQRLVVLAMADSGHSDSAIACATGWSREYVMHVLGERTERSA
jgi:hypothetical protein